MAWIFGLVAILALALWAFVYIIVKWVLGDAPPGSTFWGIRSEKQPPAQPKPDAADRPH